MKDCGSRSHPSLLPHVPNQLASNEALLNQSPHPAPHPATSAAVASFFSTALPNRPGRPLPSVAARMCLQIGAPVPFLVNVPPKRHSFLSPSISEPVWSSPSSDLV